MKLAWLTDIHLNFIELSARIEFYNNISATDCDAVLISGDIAEACSIESLLKEMSSHIDKPIYFILGNHDYYKGRIEHVQAAMLALTAIDPLLHYLPKSTCEVLTKDTLLLGQDSWADGRLGDYQNSKVVLNDSRLITNLFQESVLGKYPLLNKMQQLADFDAAELYDKLHQALNLYRPKKVIILIHVPPFKESCMHQGKISDDDWLPYFSSKAMGDVLMQVAEEYAEVEFLVLCGHTHSVAVYQPCENLLVKTGKAEYYRPEIQDVFEV